jgi:predicted metal-dependent phosphoesterase TrpH
MIDLHLHSTVSDGTFAPAALIDLAARKRIPMVALTDHDTVGGVREFLEAAGRTPGVEAIGGVEISAVCDRHHAHVLGYGLEFPSERFLAMLRAFQEERVIRGQRIVERLRDLGIDVTFDEAVARAKGDCFGRPHVAGLLVEKGVVANVDEAFREFLARGARAYVERDRPSGEDAVRALREEGMVPVLAHPTTMRLSEDDLDGLIRRLRDTGLMGIEGFYTTFSREDMDRIQILVARHGLLRTGGSDFHGAIKPHIEMGVGLGDLRVPEAIGERLVRAIESLSSRSGGRS